MWRKILGCHAEVRRVDVIVSEVASVIRPRPRRQETAESGLLAELSSPLADLRRVLTGGATVGQGLC
jgi:hypothetical protein